ncbi:hypothetical protein ATI61_112284 [Archangium gephyra]|uniref:Lipoprotein n=1 Tax=Archangium gephyra TaxID=48 RepID=A0AAC8Q5Q8_9BACT|nr:hypothetical protein [Archangium gephyra]AKJ01026.1 putative lipoprotein [Archangium gephyra]REG26189.1 hypothetical protein ATI61_112284 [Archangium gephyra]
MRVGRGAGVVLALALGACRSRDAGAPDAGVLPPPSALTCEGLITPELRDALPGFTVKEERTCPTCGPLCTFRSAEQKDVTVSIAYDCHKLPDGQDVRGLLAPTLRAGGVEIPALGKAAARREPVPGMTQVVAWDDDTPCGVVVTWLGKDRDRAPELARTTLFAITRERLMLAGTPPAIGGSTPDAGPEPDAGSL